MTEERRALYGNSGGRWLLAQFSGAPSELPARIGDMSLLGEPEAVLARLYARLRQQQEEEITEGRKARAAHGRALAAWEAADPATRGPAPQPPDGRQSTKPGPWPGVQRQLAVRIGVGQQAVSRYLSRRSRMVLDDAGWAALVRASYELGVTDG
ncbi:hypothetical protein ACFOOM_12270 [Streptomyces echinoruber]|uniref:Uncharacterized protein n=1 Tax=Streptomyces echinoruber TaxID=68898 RepID=A0A918VHB5_9ACTN|nr:hypothetical protein [Streptomyces echinoruber]GHA01290.1 hypothetical protein GCM10010389_45790 [Streptomyces echinoruber]